ncbi:MAG: aspartate aminotransferase family protein [Proteobacteria bacterium]|nr:aspartate aminotransferase family protein [Pseudomonadota bacterium]
MSAVFFLEPKMSYPTAVRGEGMYLYDAGGKQYLDMSGGAAVSCLGHGHPDVVRAVQEQAGKLAFAHTSFFTNEPQEDLADRLAKRFSEEGSRVWFTSGGSESNETALKVAWQYWRAQGKPEKTIIISREFSYHGGTLGATSVSGSVFRRAPYEKVLHDWPRISPCYPWRHKYDSETDRQYGHRVAAELDEAIRVAGAENVAAFIAEPVVGATLGVVPPVPGYFAEIRRICDEHDVLFIADEVMCGSGRCGTFYAHEPDEIIPDLVTIAKGLGGGYQPIGAIITRKHICESIANDPGGFAHGHTYIGHAISCAAGVAIQKCFDDGILASVSGKGDRLLQILRDRFQDHPSVGDIRGRGLFAGIEFVANRDTKEAYPVERRIPAKLKSAAMEHGLICYPGGGTVDGRKGAHLLLAPPFIAEDRHFEELADKLDKVFDTVFS